nr:MAG TPA: hypothetical protein [Caudoviricetes sp.]
MSNNRKQQASYDYLHKNKPVRGKLLWSILNKWNRHNCEWGEWRKMRKTKQEQIISKEYE